MKIALTASINLARHIGLLTFKKAYEDQNITDFEIQTCPIELNAGRISGNSRDVFLKGKYRNKELKIRVSLDERDGTWQIGGASGTYDDCHFGWTGVWLADMLGLPQDSLGTTD